MHFDQNKHFITYKKIFCSPKPNTPPLPPSSSSSPSFLLPYKYRYCLLLYLVSFSLISLSLLACFCGLTADPFGTNSLRLPCGWWQNPTQSLGVRGLSLGFEDLGLESSFIPRSPLGIEGFPLFGPLSRCLIEGFSTDFCCS